MRLTASRLPSFVVAFGGMEAVDGVFSVWRIYEGLPEGGRGFGGAMLLEEELTKLLASRDDGAGGDGKFLHGVFLISGGAHLGLGFFRFAVGLEGPGEDFHAKDAGLCSPILVAHAMKLILISGERGDFGARV